MWPQFVPSLPCFTVSFCSPLLDLLTSVASGLHQTQRHKFSRKRSISYHNCIRSKSGFPGGTSSKESPPKAGDVRDVGLIPGSEDSPGEGNGYPLQDSYMEKPMDRVHGYSPWGCKESDTTEWLTLSLLHFQIL